MKLELLSAKTYLPQGPNYGDCILIDTDTELVVFDCGCEKHAKRVETYMAAHHRQSAVVVLSHNDADHFDGIPYLAEKGLVSAVYTHLFLKYKDELLDLVQSPNLKRETVGKRIEEIYDNVKSLGGQVVLKDAFEFCEVAPGIKIVGPTKDYALEAVAKRIDGRESDNIDAETIVNAISVQVSVDFNGSSALLCGDCAFEAVEGILADYTVLQLPHHGKSETAEKFFAAKAGENGTVYLVSDNTGDSNGGSSKLDARGHNVKNTKNGDVMYPAVMVTGTGSGGYTSRTLGRPW